MERVLIAADLVFPHASASLVNVYLYSLLRRCDITWNTGKEKERQDIIRRGRLLIDCRYHAVYWEDHQLKDLNEREIAFLYLLADAPRQVVKHEIIFE